MSVIESAVKDGKLSQPEDPEICVGLYIFSRLNLGQLPEVSELSDDAAKGLGSAFLYRTGVQIEEVPYISSDNLREVIHQILDDSVQVN